MPDNPWIFVSYVRGHASPTGQGVSTVSVRHEPPIDGPEEFSRLIARVAEWVGHDEFVIVNWRRYEAWE